jgi:hypothetical protein
VYVWVAGRCKCTRSGSSTSCRWLVGAGGVGWGKGRVLVSVWLGGSMRHNWLQTLQCHASVFSEGGTECWGGVVLPSGVVGERQGVGRGMRLSMEIEYGDQVWRYNQVPRCHVYTQRSMLTGPLLLAAHLTGPLPFLPSHHLLLLLPPPPPPAGHPGAQRVPCRDPVQCVEGVPVHRRGGAQGGGAGGCRPESIWS